MCEYTVKDFANVTYDEEYTRLIGKTEITNFIKF